MQLEIGIPRQLLPDQLEAVEALDTGGTGAGQSGSTGGIWVIADPTTMSNVPTGQHHYDLELNSSNSTIRLIEGRFEVKGNVTR